MGLQGQRFSSVQLVELLHLVHGSVVIFEEVVPGISMVDADNGETSHFLDRTGSLVKYSRKATERSIHQGKVTRTILSMLTKVLSSLVLCGVLNLAWSSLTSIF